MKVIRIYGCSKDKETKDLLKGAAIYFLDSLLPRKRKINIKISAEAGILYSDDIYGECYHLDKSKFWIRLDSELDRYNLISTLAHEFVHVRQFDTGQLQFKAHCNKWDGSFYPNDGFKRNQEPWEIEARRLEKKLAKKYLKQIDDL